MAEVDPHLKCTRLACYPRYYPLTHSAIITIKMDKPLKRHNSVPKVIRFISCLLGLDFIVGVLFSIYINAGNEHCLFGKFRYSLKIILSADCSMDCFGRLSHSDKNGMSSINKYQANSFKSS